MIPALAACAVLHALGGGSARSASGDNTVKLLLDTADALLERAVTSATEASPELSIASGARPAMKAWCCCIRLGST
jgi:hypothetical protein